MTASCRIEPTFSLLGGRTPADASRRAARCPGRRANKKKSKEKQHQTKETHINKGQRRPRRGRPWVNEKRRPLQRAGPSRFEKWLCEKTNDDKRWREGKEAAKEKSNRF